MPSYFADNEDLQFYFDRGLDWAGLIAVCERGDDAVTDVAEAVAGYRDVAQLIGELAAEEVAPRVARLDGERPRLEGGEVIPGAAMREIFERMRALGLQQVMVPRELGGMNAPVVLEMIGYELLARADLSVMTHHSFHAGVAMALVYYSMDEGSSRVERATGKILATRFAEEIAELVRGDAWGSMDITEPGAGSDMARLRTTAEKDAEGRWTVSGQKVFITSAHGKYHVVVARTEKAASGDDPFAGLAGLSLFLVPAYEDLPDGTRVRHVTIDRIEEKLGQHASVTAAVSFDRAPAQLIGKRGEGFRYMLLLMNNARLAIGFQSIGLCEAAYRMASAYAEGRISMGKPIAQHEMIADYLDEMRTDIQALRALAMHAAYHEELARRLVLF
jgi:3-(methylthio)propanoyl-CoA dehydrogenase